MGRNKTSVWTSLSKMFQCQYQGQGKTLTVLTFSLILLCGSGIQLSASQNPSQSSTDGEYFSNSANSRSSFDSAEVNSSPQSKSSSPNFAQQSSLSSTPAVRAVSTRPTSDISTTNTLVDSDNSAPSHYGNCRRYDACPNSESWCSSLDENEKLALEAIHALHHQLDDDKNGNIDLYESNEFLREELKYDKDYEKRQENFHRNNDNQVSVRELWDTWVKSEVHNWTTEQTAEWIAIHVGLPNFQEKFLQLAINGTYLPRLAVNHHNFLSTNLGIKDVITRQKLTLKAQDVVLFGPPRDNTNHLKDMVLTSLLVVALTLCYIVFRRYKLSQRDLSKMSKDMEALMKAEELLRDLQKEMEQVKCDQEVREKEAVTHRSGSDDEDELIKLRGEVVVLRNELQRAEVELQDKCWVPPPALTHWLQLTYELESKAHNKKRQAAEKQLKQAKEACDKLKKKRSSLMGAFVATHARSIDDVDKAILEARAALTEVTQELQERMHRWKQIEILVKSPIVNNPGLNSLEILLRAGARSTPYLGAAGSVMSNSQDDIDDDGASSIYCPSAVHKLISTSAFMMYPGQNPTPFPSSTTTSQSNTRSYQQQSSSDYSSLTNYGGGDSCRPSQSPDVSRRDRANHIAQSQSYQNDNCSSDFVDCNEVSGPVSNLHTPIARSKSVQSMLSLRERGYHNRESSSKDSSNGEDDILGDAAELTAKDRRVTFRAAGADRRSGQMRSLQGRANGPLYEPMEFEDIRNFYSRKPMSANRLESSKSSEEESQRKKPPLKEEPDLIKLSTNSSAHHQSSIPIEATMNRLKEVNEDEGEEDLDEKSTADLQTQTSEPNIQSLNYRIQENLVPNGHSSTTNATPSKTSFFKTISKLMRIQSDGLHSKKTKKSLKESLQQTGDESDKQHFMNNGNNNPAPNKNNFISDKSLSLPPFSSMDEKSLQSKIKTQKKPPHKFFASLRRKTGENSNSEFIPT